MSAPAGVGQPAAPQGAKADAAKPDPAKATAKPDGAKSDAAKPAEKPKLPSVTVNGVFQADAGFFSQDPASLAQFGRIQDGADFRRARMSAKGSVTDTVNYFMQMDFAFIGRPTFTDVWVEQTALPVLGNFRVGQWKQPFSLEVVSSFRYTTFMERSLLFQPFTPFRHLGAGFYNHSDDLSMTWAASGFRSGQDQFGGSISTNGGWGTAERVTWLPYFDEPAEGRYYLHLGTGHFFSAPPNDRVTFRSIPELFIGENAPGVIGTSGQAVPGGINGTPFFANTGSLNVSSYNVLGAEKLWVHGPLSWQTEAMCNFVNANGPGNPIFYGFYSQIGWFLTGEHRPYDRLAGAIDRVKPFEDFFRVRGQGDRTFTGKGAWELANRVSYLNLNSAGVRGGTIVDYTAGVNWFWNAYTKLVFNYVLSIPNLPVTGTSHTHIFAMRAQMDF